MNLTELMNQALKIATEHGFKDATIPEDFALMHSEISEALEDFRAGKLVTHIWYEEKIPVGFACPCHNAITSMCDLVHCSKAKVIYHVADRLLPYHIRNDERVYFKPCGIPSEMADVIIRVLHFCGKHGIDIERAVTDKMTYNNTREFMHGKKL